MMTDSWFDFVNNSNYNRLYDYFVCHEPYLRTALRLCPAYSTIIDIGIGCGLSDIALAQYGHRMVCVDNDQRVLDHADRLARAFGVNLEWLINMDIVGSDLPVRSQLVMSQGLLEHFADDVIVNLLDRWSKTTKHILFEVPTDKWVGPETHGDERFMSYTRWCELIHLSGLRVTSVYCWGGSRTNPTIAHLVGFACTTTQ